MENTTKVRIYYDETHKSKKTNSDIRISVDYFSHTEVDRETSIRIRNEFKKYMSTFNCDKKDIIDIITKIRELTEDLSEYKLEVSLKKNNYWEFAKYERGRRESCGVYKKDWDDYKINYRFYIAEAHKLIDPLIKKELNLFGDGF